MLFPFHPGLPILILTIDTMFVLLHDIPVSNGNPNLMVISNSDHMGTEEMRGPSPSDLNALHLDIYARGKLGKGA